MTEDEEFEFRLRLEREQGAGKPESKAPEAKVKMTAGQMFKDELLTSLPGGLVRGVKDVIDTGAQYAAKFLGGDEAAVKSGNDAGKADFTRAQKNVGAGGSDVTRVGGQIVATLPLAGTLGAGLRGVGATRLGNAVSSGGMSLGGQAASTTAGKVGQLALRAGGGGIAGGVSAAAVNPGDGLMGAGIGAAAGPIFMAGGKIGSAIGAKLRGPEQSADLVTALKAARDAGYVVPPTQARPTLSNRIMEGLSGKLTTAQNASAANASVTNKLAARSLGLADDVQLSSDVLNSVRFNASKAYQNIGSVGNIVPDATYAAALDDIAAPYLKAAQGFPGAKPSPVIDLVESLKSSNFDAASAVEKIKHLRTASDDAFRSGNTDVARASKSGAKALEDAIETHLKASGNGALLKEFQEARKLIAKTYTVEKALNSTTGNVDGKKLAAQYAKGKPLTGELLDAAQFSQRFPKANQTIEGMGSLPQTSPLDFAAAGGLSAATGNPAMLATLLARPTARKFVLSPTVQNRLIQPEKRINGELAQALLQYSGRAAPTIYAE